MDARREKLKQLLDGELDPSEFVKDPTLASLAERIYGMDIKALMAEKGISVPEEPSISLPGAADTSAPKVEVVGGEVSELPPLPVPGAIPELEETTAPGRNKLFITLGLMALSVAVLNLFVGFGSIYNPCSTDWCQDNSKLIWLAPHLITQDGGWGPAGQLGIPDIAMCLGGLTLTLLGMRRK